MAQPPDRAAFNLALLVPLTFLLFQIFESGRISFERRSISVGNTKLEVLVAETAAEQRQGLSNRDTLDADGMLFDFGSEEIRTFWMKDTRIPLHIFFFDKTGRLVDHFEMRTELGSPEDQLTVYASKDPASYALEVPTGSKAAEQILEQELEQLRLDQK